MYYSGRIINSIQKLYNVIRFAAPDNFDIELQPLNLPKIFNEYNKNDKAFIYNLKNATLKHSIAYCNSFRYGYTLNGTNHTVDYLCKPTELSGGQITAGQYTQINVLSTSNYPESGIIRIGNPFLDLPPYGMWNEFTYTSKDATTFYGPSQTLPNISGLYVMPVISILGTNNYIIINSDLNYVVLPYCNNTSDGIYYSHSYDWLYAGKKIESIAASNSGLGSGSLKYAHYEKPNQIKTIDYCSFYGVNTLSGTLEIPEGILTIDGLAFKNCSSLTKVIIPSTINVIYTEAFYGCAANEYHIKSQQAPIVSSLINGQPAINDGTNSFTTPCVLHVKQGATGYNTTPWTNSAIFTNIIYDL